MSLAFLRRNAHFLLALTLGPLIFGDWGPAAAFLPSDTELHFLFAALSAALFLVLLVILFPERFINPRYLLLTALFAATGGMLILLCFQWLAARSLSWNVEGSNWKAVLLFYSVKLIGFSYSCVSDPEAGPLLTFLGYTIGVGFCEELCKALPVLHALETQKVFHWQDACLVGLASGTGFGISEAIHFSASEYNGHAGPDIYLIRFVSCVGLHAVWTGTAAILIFRKNVSFSDGVWAFSKILALPLLLHGISTLR